jgi:L-alanine-DL-glutamate epimerase-like enolase superfamily enzyme
MLLTDVHRFELELQNSSFCYRTPMKFGGRVVKDVTVLTARCSAELRSGRRTSETSVGLGSMTMGVAWAWPHPTLSDERKLNVLLEIAELVVDALHQSRTTGHPLEICESLKSVRDRCAADVAIRHELSEPIPELAILLAVSPIEAAIFDAHGKALGASSYALLGPEHLEHDLSRYLGAAYSGQYLSHYVSSKPVERLPLYHLVGALDPLDASDVTSPVRDGLPETLREWIDRDGLTHLKIKLAGDDFDWDLQRVLKVHRIAVTTDRIKCEWSYSLDFNERCENADYVLSLIDAIQGQSPEAMRCIRYVEQPTHRDLARFPQNDMRTVAERIPVVIDESLVDLASLRMAVSLGYSGVALKACKGHSEALLMAAVAKHDNLYLCVQDLTCVGASFLHSASLAAHIPGVQAIEGNGRQYCPAGNVEWIGNYPSLFNIRNGEVPTHLLDGQGLGF